MGQVFRPTFNNHKRWNWLEEAEIPILLKGRKSSTDIEVGKAQKYGFVQSICLPLAQLPVCLYSGQLKQA